MSGATHYRLFERTDAAATFTQIGGDFAATNVSHDTSLHRRVNAAYRVDACNSGGCVPSSVLPLAANLVPAIGYFKASNTGSGDSFGAAVALSADGNTLAVGASGEASNATGVNGDQTNNAAPMAGAVYVFTRSANGWLQQAYLKASNTDNSGGDLFGDGFGYSLALSADGNTLAVAAPSEDSNATGVNGNQANTTALQSGAVYVFVRVGSAWSQQAYVKASNTEGIDGFGLATALSADGNTLAVGASGEDSSSTGINGNQADNSANGAGAVYIFTRAAGIWSQQAYLKASNTDASDSFGFAIAISSEGDTLAVGAFSEASNAVGINGNEADNSASGAGAVYVFTRAAGTWSQQAYIKASNTEPNDSFGSSVALSGDGHTLAVGAFFEDSDAVGVNGNQANNSASESGAVYVFARTAGAWVQSAYIKASNTGAADALGVTVALSSDGATLAVSAGGLGTVGEASNAIGVGGNQSDNSAFKSGAVYVFTRVANSWSQQAYVKASNTEADDGFGRSLSLSNDGSALAVGAPVEDSSATSVGGNQVDNSAVGAGAAYLY